MKWSVINEYVKAIQRKVIGGAITSENTILTVFPNRLFSTPTTWNHIKNEVIAELKKLSSDVYIEYKETTNIEGEIIEMELLFDWS